ncbi:hypothetical protein HG535_0A08350 [Zygotorulaspora mrakii]|uniref:Assembly chaperone of RPL4 n=1 Tax=Zygotorulaspora mrakii TaxID=42260 RepID=A0A7H9AYP2_ZYGMR|nr:uncharacterized protein HG535_0A08350 [Zygotorulaspora mrakii]QLG70889.1 hypothetical protein HG535_0A08350 [Zygotorulaspora mrakii]
MSGRESYIKQARNALAENDPKKALKILKPLKKILNSSSAPDVHLLQIFADVYLENGQLQNAYPLLEKACELDLDGKKGGSDKFFTLGQVIGGQDGLNMLIQGIQNISAISGDNLDQEEAEKSVEGLLAMIEIWMTDLCMDPNAEEQCEELIQKAMEISDQKAAEVWSTLGSIRISQQRYQEASEAFAQSWNFFELKKQEIKNDLSFDESISHEKYIQLLQPLLSLMKMCIELGLYDVSLKIANEIRDIDEDNLEAHYLEGFTHYMVCKLEMFKKQNLEADINVNNVFEFNQHFQELPLNINDEDIADSVYEARISLSMASKLGETCELADEIVQELIAGTNELLKELGGPLPIQELMQIKRDEIDANQDELDLESELVAD